MLFIDSREPQNVKAALVGYFSNRCRVQISLLAQGDIAYTSRSGKFLLIERKAVPDLLNSLRDGRLQDECGRVLENADIPILLIHGSMLRNRDGFVVANGMETRWRWWSVQMALVSLQAAGMIVLTVRDSDFLDAVGHLMEWADKTEHFRTRPTNIFGKPPAQISVLADLPHIGTARAQRILERFGTLRNALENVDKWVEVEGIGKKTVQQVQQVLDEPLFKPKDMDEKDTDEKDMDEPLLKPEDMNAD